MLTWLAIAIPFVFVATDLGIHVAVGLPSVLAALHQLAFPCPCCNGLPLVLASMVAAVIPCGLTVGLVLAPGAEPEEHQQTARRSKSRPMQAHRPTGR